MTATTQRPTVAVFDFDGTLTHRDSLMGYLLRLAGPVDVARALASSSSALLQAARHDDQRDAAKAKFLATVFRGTEVARAREIGRAYAHTLVEEALRADVRARLEHHRSLGHELVIISASLDLYLDVVARRLGVAHLACTRLAVDEAGAFTGALAGANCRGPEKLRRLDALIDRAACTLWMYGDSTGDHEILDVAQHAIWVGRKRRSKPAFHDLTTYPG